MAEGYGRFTARGGEAVERLLTELADDAAARVKEVVNASEYRALIMIGGYGRGEGGVETVNGVERPHNNIDFLLIAESARRSKLHSLRERLLTALSPVMQQFEIEIDVSVVSTWKLRVSPSLIIWYDMRFGHKTILGDADYVPALKQFRLERIPSRDALRLLVNRGTLLLLNQQLIEEASNRNYKRIVRNNMKAVIGYGDALLFFLDAYHWSYVERQERMKVRDGVPDDFRSLYDEAANFRFQPDYERYRSRDLLAWGNELRAALEPVHRICEERRLGAVGFAWDDYPAIAARHALFSEPLSARAWIRKAMHAIQPMNAAADLAFGARLGSRVMGAKDRSMLAFPLLAYALESSNLKAFAAATLNLANDADLNAMREAYVRLWCEAIDINAQSQLRTWHLPVAEENGR